MTPDPSGPNNVSGTTATPAHFPHHPTAAVLMNRTTPVHRVPHPRARAVLAATRKAGRTGQRSTLEHHPRNLQPVETTGHRVLGAALDHHTSVAASAP